MSMNNHPDRITKITYTTPQNKVGPFTSTDAEIRFDFPRGNVDFATLALYVEVSASNATCSLPETCGAAALFKTLQFFAGGTMWDNEQYYGNLIAHEMTSRMTYGSDPAQNGGSSEMFGRGAALGSGVGNAVVYRVPLRFSALTAGLKLNLEQFTGKTYLNLLLNENAAALYDTAATGVYTIHRAYCTHMTFREEDTVELINGDSLLLTTHTASNETAATTGSMHFTKEADNALRVLLSANVDTTGYATATDDKYRSNMADLTALELSLNGRPYPDSSLGKYSMDAEVYEMSHLAAFPTRNIQRLSDSYIAYSDFTSAATRFGFIAFPLYARSKRFVENGIGKVHAGTRIRGQDLLRYSQTAATGAQMIMHLEYTIRLLYQAGGMTLTHTGF